MSLFDEYFETIKKVSPDFSLRTVFEAERNLWDLREKLYSSFNVPCIEVAHTITDAKCYYSAIEECLDKDDSNEAREIKQALEKTINKETVQPIELKAFIETQIQIQFLDTMDLESWLCPSFLCLFSSEKTNLQKALKAIVENIPFYDIKPKSLLPLRDTVIAEAREKVKEERKARAQRIAEEKQKEKIKARAASKEQLIELEPSKQHLEIGQLIGGSSGTRGKQPQPHRRSRSSDDNCRARTPFRLSPY